jgi:hypothetical protein
VARSAITVTVHIEGVRQTLRKFQALPKDASNRLRDKSKQLAEFLALKAKAAAIADSPQAALMAPTIKAVRDRVPVVQAGGPKRVGRNKKPAYGLLFGSEFGMTGRSGWFNNAQYQSSTGRQYRPHRGSRGYWFFPLVESEAPAISRAWNQAADEAVAEFVKGGNE